MHKNSKSNGTHYSRRDFIKVSSIGVAGSSLLLSIPSAHTLLKYIPTIDNPLEYYQDRDWEKMYRDQYAFDDTFSYVCSPNCTHECRMRGFVRNGVLVRTEQNYDNHNVRYSKSHQAEKLNNICYFLSFK